MGSGVHDVIQQTLEAGGAFQVCLQALHIQRVADAVTVKCIGSLRRCCLREGEGSSHGVRFKVMWLGLGATSTSLPPFSKGGNENG